MRATAWSNGKNQYGIRVGMKNRRLHFLTEWESITVFIDGQPHKFKLTSGFWNQCPEFRDSSEPVIKSWLARQEALEWPKGKPPVFDLQPLGGNRFSLEKV
ncbi:hypothetical protein SAMN04487956_13920 [Halomonas saccharevitans]|uniref:Uncharacterized protein n=1 Tax=Halomonas saccharevitans TaxID=416872 RepID=A0A1I7CA72_9GAMM|nr:hypothetical protein SAMN04487956_13920 [Halomonas saccharevitans]